MRHRLQNYYVNMIVKLTLFTTLVVLLLSLLLYASFRNYNIKTINQLNENLMVQFIHNAEQIHAYLRSYSVSLTNNTDVKNLMFGEDLSVYETLGSMRAVDLLLEANPYLESIYVYNGRSDTYYVVGANSVIRKGGEFDAELDAVLKGDAPIPRLTPIPRRLPGIEAEAGKDTQVFTYIVPDFFRDGQTLKSALILNAKVDSFLHNVAAKSESGSGMMDMKSLWFLGREGEVLAHTNKALFLQNVAGREDVKRMMESGERSGYFTDRQEGKTSVVTYVRSELLDWMLVGATPYEAVAGLAERVRGLSLIIGILMLTVGLVAAIALTRNLYAPVRRLRNKFSPYAPAGQTSAPHANEFEMISEAFSLAHHKLRDLEQFKNSKRQVLKQKTLEDYVRTGLPLGRREQEWLDESGIRLSPRRPAVVAVLRIDRYSAFCETYNESDRALLRYALTNMLSEIIRPGGECEAVDMGADQTVVILNVEPDSQHGPGWEARLAESLEQARRSFERYCGVSFSVFVSEPMALLREVPQAYRDALELSQERIKAGHGCMLFRSEVGAAQPTFFNINHQLLEQLLEAIKEAKQDKMEDTYRRLTELLQASDYNNIMFTLSYLSAAIFNQLHVMEGNRTISFGLSFSEFDKRLKAMETFEEIDAEFLDLFRTIVQRIQGSQQDRTNLIVAQALRYIEEHYADAALSPQQIADLFKLTPAYLNKLCRERTSRSLSDSITEVRVEKAKQLLGRTSLTIDQVIDRVGWENKKYFFRIFKKQVGATPTEYRLKLSVDQIDRS
ncbi:AraC family transcriptional regulator [Paenibacillus hodogayensis]|uniref:AraC family transcriptional regulator n=1 Tax=Paenibacillus hodogayensis TaxID=279208 RepID=A0ABV5W631_9BACL